MLEKLLNYTYGMWQGFPNRITIEEMVYKKVVILQLNNRPERGFVAKESLVDIGEGHQSY